MLMSPLFIFLILNLYLMLGETLIKHHLSDSKTALRSPLCSEKLPWGKEEEKDNRQEFQVQFPENNSSCFCIIYPISQKELSLQHRIEAPLSEAKHRHTHTHTHTHTHNKTKNTQKSYQEALPSFLSQVSLVEKGQWWY